jgi:hypothetical protein
LAVRPAVALAERGPTVTHIHEATRKELEARRQAILDELGVSYDDLAERARTYALVAEEWPAWDRIREIDFLLANEE